MKAIFAVTALAAAVSAQAIAADTEITTSVSGAVKFVTTVDLLETDPNDVDGGDITEIDVYLDEEDDADDGGNYGLYIDWDIVNGPFSANVEFAGEDGDFMSGDGADLEITVNDVMVSEGAYSFGQLGQLDDTVGYAHLMGEVDGDDFGYAEGIGVDAAFGYTMGGLSIQLEGNQGTEADGYGTASTAAEGSDYGVGAQYAGSADALSYVVEGQVRASSLASDDSSSAYFVGAGATYSADLVTVVAGVNTFTNTVADANDESLVLVGAELTVTPTADSSVYGKGTMLTQSESDVDASSEYLVGATYQIDAIGLTAEYTMVEVGDNSIAIDNDSDFAFLGATLDSGALSYYVEVELYMDESEADPLFEAGVSTTTESGITYAADFDFQADVETDLTVSASYSF